MKKTSQKNTLSWPFLCAQASGRGGTYEMDAPSSNGWCIITGLSALEYSDAIRYYYDQEEDQKSIELLTGGNGFAIKVMAPTTIIFQQAGELAFTLAFNRDKVSVCCQNPPTD